MIRTLIVVLMLVVLGVLTNVLVAWGCTVWSSLGFVPNQPLATEWPMDVPETWQRPTTMTALRGFGVERTTWQSFPTMGLRLTQPRTVGGERRSGRAAKVTIHRAGWPMRSLRAIEMTEGFAGDVRPAGVRASVWREGIVVSGMPGWTKIHGRQRLPVEPVWVGSAVNTGAYALGWGAAWFGVFGWRGLRRRWRERRGLCPSCGYDAGEAERCPECGAPSMTRLHERHRPGAVRRACG